MSEQFNPPLPAGCLTQCYIDGWSDALIAANAMREAAPVDEPDVSRDVLSALMVAIWKVDPLRQNLDLDDNSRAMFEKAARACIAALAAGDDR